MSLGGCPYCGSHPHHSIGCPVAMGYVRGPLGAAMPSPNVIGVSRERLVALCRLLIDSGDMTPMAERMLLRAYDEDAGSES